FCGFAIKVSISFTKGSIVFKEREYYRSDWQYSSTNSRRNRKICKPECAPAQGFQPVQLSGLRQRLRAVLATQIFQRLHLQQSTAGTLEHEGQLGATIEFRQRHLCGDDQLDIAVIEFVHQTDKASGLVVLFRTQPGYIAEQNRMVRLRQLDVIICAARPAAQLLEIEPDHVVGAALCGDLPT